MANWYVSQKVAASGVGTSLAVAFKKISDAITAAAANDTIYIYEGIYNESNAATKNLNLIGRGNVVVHGGYSLANAISTTTNGITFKCYNLYFIGFTSYVFYSNAVEPANYYFYNCYIPSIFLNNQYRKKLYLYNNVIGTLNFGTVSAGNLFEQNYQNNTFCSTTNLPQSGSQAYTFNCNIFYGNLYCPYVPSLFYYNNINNIKFSSGASYALVTSTSEIEAKYLLDVGSSGIGKFNTNVFYIPDFNNITKVNYTLKYDVANNPIAFATFQGTAIGAFQASAKVVCKDTANGGDCDVYNIGTDLYSLGIFGGKTNVGAIDNVNEKLYRTSDGTNNWGVFVASTELPKTHVIRNLQMFGTIIDRNGGQVTKLGSDFAYNYQIDVLVKWSDTLSKAALLAETSRPFVRFRLRPNESNYYVNNAGILVGDGEPTYLSLVNSTDGGSGSLVPTKVTAKSFVCIIILQDA